MCTECFWFGREEVCWERERNKEAKNDPEETRWWEDDLYEEKQASSPAERRPVGHTYVRTHCWCFQCVNQIIEINPKLWHLQSQHISKIPYISHIF